MVRKIATVLVSTAALVLCGCAAEVVKGSTSPPPSIAAGAGKVIVFNITGNPEWTATAKDWEDFKKAWREAMTEATGAAGMTCTFQEGEPKASGDVGTLVAVYVNDYRYVSTTARIMFGIMTGNGFVDAKVRFIDLKSGAQLGEQTYNTTSHVGEGIGSAMTYKQLQALSKAIVADIATK